MGGLNLLNTTKPWRNISAIEGGYWVRFTHHDKLFCHKTFYVSKYGSDQRALTMAQIFRNACERRFIAKGLHKYYPSLYWSDARVCYIVGLNWNENMHMGYLTTFLKSYTFKPLNKTKSWRTFSIKRHGLQGAFNKAVIHLEGQRKIHYPPKVIRKAWFKLAAHHSRYSVNDKIKGIRI